MAKKNDDTSHTFKGLGEAAKDFVCEIADECPKGLVADVVKATFSNDDSRYDVRVVGKSKEWVNYATWELGRFVGLQATVGRMLIASE